MNREDMKVLVTGSKGQLGMEMMSVLNQHGIPAIGYGRSEMDVANAEQVMDIMEMEHPTQGIASFFET